MRINSISWRNLGPFGNALQRVEFSPAGGLWMISGHNGAGKSFFINLPKILYYGRLENFKKEDISNRINKHGWIRGEIEVSPSTLVTIERVLSPSDLKVHKYLSGEGPDDSNDIGKAGIKNYQDYIDLEVTGLPYYIFSNIISLSINDFKSFVSMSPSDKRIIIDKIFAMEVLNKMYELAKKDLREIKINIDLLDREALSIEKSINDAGKELERLKRTLEEDLSKKKEEIEQKLGECKGKLIEALGRKEEWEEKLGKLNSSYDSFKRQKGEIEVELRSAKHKIELFEKEKCPTCETPFIGNRFDMIKESLNEFFDKKSEDFKGLLGEEKKYQEAFKKLNGILKETDGYLLSVKSLAVALKSEYSKLDKDPSKELGSIRNLISKHAKDKIRKEGEKEKFDSSAKKTTILSELYGDSGVKKRIMDSYLPTLNREIEYTLNELHFPYSLKFNNEFEPIIEHLGIEINVGTLSTGEKKRVDLAVLISIIRMIKRKYPLLNIFMLDEVLSSIDPDGIYDILGVLQKTAKELSINLFIINHSPLPVEYFSYKVEIKKNAGFSDIIIEKLEENGD